MLTVSDFINLIQYFYYNNNKTYEIETIQIAQLTDKYHSSIKLNQQRYSIHPMATLYDAALMMSETRAHRIPLVVENREIISVITQYRLLKFIANNVSYLYVVRLGKRLIYYVIISSNKQNYSKYHYLSSKLVYMDLM